MQRLLTDQFLKDLKSHQKKRNDKLLSKIWGLILETDKYTHEPLSGNGNPELLKHLGPNVYSRKINMEHRLVYRQSSDSIAYISCFGHYTKV